MGDELKAGEVHEVTISSLLKALTEQHSNCIALVVVKKQVIPGNGNYGCC